ncbi:MAG: penicillin-binding protein [Caulobacteraceae bacterium]|nr:penicillin-binding protein [Caulobacteraceae bacterium]
MPPDPSGASRRVRGLVLGLVGMLGVQAGLLALDAAFPPDLTRARHASPVVLDRNGAWLRALPVEDGRWRIRADLARTDPGFLRRVTRIEDGHFYLHPGVDPLAVVRAIGSAALHGHATSGASTLTMQAARLLKPHPRDLLGKVVEMVRALQLQARYSKPDLLALYLTLAPYGGNLEGVRAASLAYFGHEPESLTPAEQALLIALPQSPEARRPDRRPKAAKAARDHVLDKMALLGLLAPAEADEARAEPLPGRAPFPAVAWQVAGELARDAPARQASIVTTLDGPLQTRLESLAAAAAKTQGANASVAILVVEIRTRAVRAAVASAGRDTPGGWLDLTLAQRSPGSSLKPFIYGLAFDEGLAAPDTLIDDSPRRFGDYQPEDFDRNFHGLVSAREALVHSLNVPAVAMLDKLGAANFESRLQGAGADLLRPQAGLTDPGLALALGGVGISLRDLAMLYAALGDEGLAKPLAWTEGQAAARPGQGGRRLMRAAAATTILDILREGAPPDGRPPSALTLGGPALAFKTGTSYGYRDALAAGVGGGYAIVVWTGRADGGARAGLTGRDAALPLLFDVADAVGAGRAAPRAIAPISAPRALGQLQAATGQGPRLIFPPDGASLQVDTFGPSARGLVLAARGQGLSWYVDGRPLAPTPDGQILWKPAGPGFYRITVVDAAGAQASARVRVRS